MGFDGSIPTDNPFTKTPNAQDSSTRAGIARPGRSTTTPRAVFCWSPRTVATSRMTMTRSTALFPARTTDGPGSSGMDGRRSRGPTAWKAPPRPGFHTGATPALRASAPSSSPPPAAGGGYPVKYHGKLFYADFARKSVRSAPILPGTGRPGGSEAFLQGLAAGPLALRRGPDGALYVITHGGAPKASTNDAVVRVVWNP